MRIGSLLVKELNQFFRDRVMLALTLYFYTACVVICASALSFDITDLPLVILDEDRSSASRALRAAFRNTEAFDLLEVEWSQSEAAEALQSGDAGVVVTVPLGFERQLRRGDTTALQVWLDGANSNSAAAAAGYVDAVVGRLEAELVPESSRLPRARAVTRVWYNPEQSTTPFMVLSMIALAGMLVGMVHPAASIVREKEQGTIEQLLVTPITVGELFFAKTFPTLIVGLMSLFISLLVVALFDVPLRGSLSFLVVATAVFLLSAVALGVLVATFCRTLQQSLLLSFFGLFPIMFLSGTLSPLESMPDALQTASMASPLRYYMQILLAVFLKGAGWGELWPRLIPMLLIGLTLFAVSLFAFRRSLR